MNQNSDSFANVIVRLKVGDEQAAWVVFQRYAQQLVYRARLKLDARLKQRVDPEDVVQSVFRSFFQRFADGQLQLENWDSLWSLLVVITLRKCSNLAKFHHRECRAACLEAVPLPGDDSTSGWEVAGSEPTPEEVAMLAETLEGLLGELEPSEREIIELSLQGYTAMEIKDRLGRAERSVRRVRERVRERLERLRDEG